MSYGHEPFYIFECGCKGQDVDLHEMVHPAERHVVIDYVVVRYDAIAQLVASMANRDNDEIYELIQRGKDLQPEISNALAIEVRGRGWIR